MSSQYAAPLTGNALDNLGDVAGRIVADSGVNERAFKAVADLREILRDEQSGPIRGRILHRAELAKTLRTLAIWVERNGSLPRPFEIGDEAEDLGYVPRPFDPADDEEDDGGCARE